MPEFDDLTLHNKEIQENLEFWGKKPLLKQIYFDFYRKISRCLIDLPGLHTIEIGSGIGNINEVIPDCIRTDLFANPWIDQLENAYDLSFENNSVANIILFDIFHHLKYPETAFNEFKRVLSSEGRIIIFEPYMSLLGLFIFGLLHHEPLGLTKTIEFKAPEGWQAEDSSYYAAQGNASRIFFRRKYKSFLTDWHVDKVVKMSAISYVASGGYSKPQLYPDKALPILKVIDRFCDLFPSIFATRVLVVLKKR